MSRTYYTDYVRHALRFYARNHKAQPSFRSEADKSNWLACHSVLGRYNDNERNILISIYSGHDTLADEVYNTCKKYNVEQSGIWDMMKEFERKIAHRRGLI